VLDRPIACRRENWASPAPARHIRLSCAGGSPFARLSRRNRERVADERLDPSHAAGRHFFRGAPAFGFARYLRSGTREIVSFTVKSQYTERSADASATAGALQSNQRVTFSCPCPHCSHLNKTSISLAELEAPDTQGVPIRRGGTAGEHGSVRVEVICTHCRSTLSMSIERRDPQLTI
jgi:hypothetical protein